MEAACEVTREGIRVVPEIMIPLVGLAAEMKAQKDLVREVAADTMRRYQTKFPYLVGTMIELPRAAITADKIAREADFFSFGTNDLTQTTFGFSRDDAAKFTDFYMNRRDRCPRCLSREVDQKTMQCRACGLRLSETPDNILEPGRGGRPHEAGDRTGPDDAAGYQAGDLRRAWRRSRVHRLLSHPRPRLCQLLAVPGADREARRGTGRHQSRR